MKIFTGILKVSFVLSIVASVMFFIGWISFSFYSAITVEKTYKIFLNDGTFEIDQGDCSPRFITGMWSACIEDVPTLIPISLINVIKISTK